MLKYQVNLFVLFLLITISSCTIDEGQIGATKAASIQEFENSIAIEYNKIESGSFIAWRASHLGGLQPRQGKIYCEQATISVENGNISNTTIIIDMNNLTVESLPENDAKELADHLKSDDFFSINTYPTSKFELTKIVKAQGEFNTEVTGNLTILGVTKSITFKANQYTAEDKVSIKSEDFEINRSDWGMTYNAKGTAGVPLDYLISDDIGFTIDLVVTR